MADTEQLALEPLAEWARLQRFVDDTRPAVIAAAWNAGCRNVAELARVAGVSRSTVYSDLASSGVDIPAMTYKQRHGRE